MKIGITGATGQLGRLVVEQLKARTSADNLVALVRSPEKAADLQIEARAFDYNKRDGLATPLSGIDYLLLISGNEIGSRATQHRNVIEAAQEAGIQWIVYTSLLHADRSSLSLAAEHLATEELLKAADIPYTILRNGWYTENYTGSIAPALANGTLVGAAGNGKISSAPRIDYAEAAAVILSSSPQAGKVYELAGDQYYTLTDLAAEITQQSGKVVSYLNLSEEDYAKALVQAGLPEAAAKAYASFDTGAAHDDLYDDGKQLSALIGHPTTPLEDTVKVTLGHIS